MKNYKLILMAMMVAMFSTSCLVDDEDETLDAMSSTPYAIGFETTVRNVTYFEDIGAVEVPVALNVLAGGDGTGVESNTVVSYTVNQDLTTAVEGQEYTINGEAGSITIPAGAEFGTLDLVVNTGQLDPDQATYLVLDLTASPEGSEIIEAYSQLTVNFVGCVSEVDQFTYLVTTTDGTGAIVSQGMETITVFGSTPNTFVTESTGSIGPNGTFGSISPPAPRNGYFFTDVCGDITIPEQNLGDYYSNQVFGTGTVLPNGDIEMTYNITQSPTLFTNPYTSTFVKQ